MRSSTISINKLNQCMKISVCSIRTSYTTKQITWINHNYLPPSNLLRGSWIENIFSIKSIMLTILDFLTNTDLLPTFFPLNTTCYFFFKGKRLAHTILSIKQNHSRLERLWNDIWLPKPILVIKILINIFDLYICKYLN